MLIAAIIIAVLGCAIAYWQYSKMKQAVGALGDFSKELEESMKELEESTESFE